MFFVGSSQKDSRAVELDLDPTAVFCRSALGCPSDCVYYLWCVSTLQEDAHAVELDLDPATGAVLFGVFDGHGGRQVADLCAANVVGSRAVAGSVEMWMQGHDSILASRYKVQARSKLEASSMPSD